MWADIRIGRLRAKGTSANCMRSYPFKYLIGSFNIKVVITHRAALSNSADAVAVLKALAEADAG